MLLLVSSKSNKTLTLVMQSKEFAAPFEKVMILQIVLNLKKRLQELPSAGYALSGPKAEHTFILQGMLLAGDVLPLALSFGPMQRHVASKSVKWHSRAAELVSLRTLTSTKPKLRRRELNPGFPRDWRKY